MTKWGARRTAYEHEGFFILNAFLCFLSVVLPIKVPTCGYVPGLAWFKSELFGFERDSWRGVRFDHVDFEQLIYETTGLSLLIDFFMQPLTNWLSRMQGRHAGV